VLAPKKSRTKDDHDDEDDFGEGRMSKGEYFSFGLLLILGHGSMLAKAFARGEEA
jgi:hypothetical protein